MGRLMFGNEGIGNEGIEGMDGKEGMDGEERDAEHPEMSNGMSRMRKNLDFDTFSMSASNIGPIKVYPINDDEIQPE